MQDELLVFNLSDLLDERVLSDKEFLSRLFAFAEEFALSGNIWRQYILYRLLLDENVYALFSERGETAQSTGTLKDLARRDIELIMDFIDPEYLENNCAIAPQLMVYRPLTAVGRRSGRRIAALNDEITASLRPGELLELLTAEYERGGAGMFAFSDAFTVADEGDELVLKPVKFPDRRSIGHLVGYDSQKDALIKNTRAFLDGKPYNDVLLYGDAGTGKSSAVRSLPNVFLGRRLKLIEVDRSRYRQIPQIIDRLSGRGVYCILMLDDLSFDEQETEYKYLKAFLEGGARKRPKNVAVYATSNRRRLIAERFSDRADTVMRGDMHASETMEEKHSLSGRFGLSLFFPSPDEQAFVEIALALKEREGIEDDEELFLQKLRAWQVANGKRTGRMAEQFIHAYKAGEPI